MPKSKTMCLRATLLLTEANQLLKISILGIHKVSQQDTDSITGRYRWSYPRHQVRFTDSNPLI